MGRHKIHRLGLLLLQEALECLHSSNVQFSIEPICSSLISCQANSPLGFDCGTVCARIEDRAKRRGVSTEYPEDCSGAVPEKVLPVECHPCFCILPYVICRRA
jgi:hypothetical protein